MKEIRCGRDRRVSLCFGSETNDDPTKPAPFGSPETRRSIPYGTSALRPRSASHAAKGRSERDSAKRTRSSSRARCRRAASENRYRRARKRRRRSLRRDSCARRGSRRWDCGDCRGGGSYSFGILRIVRDEARSQHADLPLRDVLGGSAVARHAFVQRTRDDSRSADRVSRAPRIARGS